MFIGFTLLFIVVAAAMILIILVQRPQGGGLAGAFGGAGGGGTDTVFGGRVGDALTWATVIAFAVYLGLAISLNFLDQAPATPAATPGNVNITTTDEDGGTTELPLVPSDGPPGVVLPGTSNPAGPDNSGAAETDTTSPPPEGGGEAAPDTDPASGAGGDDGQNSSGDDGSE